ncbi:MAG TPA: GAF domain-containing protein, partial [Actinomycetota bacterium]|nr:GAF domain-containing protein [Actinomycetota bacterium]
MPIDRRSVTRELRLLLQGVDGLAGDGLAAALQRVAEAATMLLRAQGAGVMLADEHQVLRYAAASDPPARALAAAQEHLRAGPALDSFASALPVGSRDVTTDSRWPDLRHLVDRSAVRAVLSTPLSLPGDGPIGALNLHSSRARDWEVAEMAASLAYAGVVASLVSMAVEARLRGVLLDRLLAALRGVGD